MPNTVQVMQGYTPPITIPKPAGESHFPRLAEFTLFIIVLYVFQIFTPIIENPDYDSVRFQIEASRANAFNQIFWLTTLGVIGTMVLRQPQRCLDMALLYWPLGLLMVHVAASSLWAVDPSISFRRAVLAVIIASSVALIGIYIRDSRRMMFVLYAAFFVLLGQCFVALGFGSSFTDENEFRGFQNHKNTLGALIGYGIIVGLFLFRYLEGVLQKLLNLFYLASFGVFLILAQSKTAIQEVILVPPLILAAYPVSRVLRVSMGTVLLAIGMILGILYYFTVIGAGVDAEYVLGLFFDDVTFTGRVDIWTYVWEEAEKRWLLGYGHQSFWAIGLKSVNLDARIFFIRSINHAHNGFLDIWLTLGVVGLLIFLPLLWQFDRGLRIARDSHPMTHVTAWAVMLYALIHNLSESTILQGQNFPWLAMLVVIAAAERARHDHEVAMRGGVPVMPPVGYGAPDRPMAPAHS